MICHYWDIIVLQYAKLIQYCWTNIGPSTIKFHTQILNLGRHTIDLPILSYCSITVGAKLLNIIEPLLDQRFISRHMPILAFGWVTIDVPTLGYQII